MRVDIKLTDIFRPCNECINVNECAYWADYAEKFDEDNVLKHRLYDIFKYGTDCFRGPYDEEDCE